MWIGIFPKEETKTSELMRCSTPWLTFREVQMQTAARFHPIPVRKLLAKHIRESLASVGEMTWSWRSLFRCPQKKPLAMADRHLLAGGRMGVNQNPGQSHPYIGITPKFSGTNIRAQGNMSHDPSFLSVFCCCERIGCN